MGTLLTYELQNFGFKVNMIHVSCTFLKAIYIYIYMSLCQERSMASLTHLTTTKVELKQLYYLCGYSDDEMSLFQITSTKKFR